MKVRLVHPDWAASARHAARQAASGAFAKGFTLVELMVSVAIIAILMLSFSLVLTSSQQVVSMSQKGMRANDASAALADLIRQDLASLATDGFLAIYAGNPDLNHCRVMFTTTGTYQSMVSANVATSARIDYGVFDATASSSSYDARQVLWRRALLLTGITCNNTPPSFPPAASDLIGDTLAGYKLSANINLVTFTTSVRNAMNANPALNLPPTRLIQVQALWPYVYHPCTLFTVEWTNDTNLVNWYSPPNAPAPAMGQPDRRGANPLIWKFGDTDWPLALRIRFRLVRDSNLLPKPRPGEDDNVAPYEMIVRLRKPS